MGTWYLAHDSRPMEKSQPDLEKWFGEGVDPALAREALVGIRAWVKKEFGEGADLMQTPAMTGCELLRFKLPFGMHYEQLPASDRALVHATSPQGRKQHFFDKETIVRYDGRKTYLACCSRVPVYDPKDFIHDQEPSFTPYRPGRYKVDVTVPHSWRHVGLVHRGIPKEALGRSNEYPNQPGEEFTTWLTEFEIRRLLMVHNWLFAVRERMLFSSDKSVKTDPLVNWAKPFRETLEAIEQHPLWGTPKIALITAGIRSIGLNAIGNFASLEGFKRSTYQSKDSIPSDVLAQPGITVQFNYKGQYEVLAPKAANAFFDRFARPEWAANIWAVARVQLTERMLKVPYQTVISCDTDAIDFSVDPQWDEGPAVGNYRKKAHG